MVARVQKLAQANQIKRTLFDNLDFRALHKLNRNIVDLNLL